MLIKYTERLMLLVNKLHSGAFFQMNKKPIKVGLVLLVITLKVLYWQVDKVSSCCVLIGIIDNSDK